MVWLLAQALQRALRGVFLGGAALKPEAASLLEMSQ